jgi:SAM-dependent methyltransferase
MQIDTSAYQRMFELEDEHWWFDGMEAITARLLDLPLANGGSHPDPSRCRVLDAGCGTGRNLRFLRRYGQVTGMDYSLYALNCCASRGFDRLVRGSVNALPFPDASFDLVTSIDVLVVRGVDPPAAMREFARVLQPGGRVLLRVAAYDWLRGQHDAEWTVERRYHRPELCEQLAAAGLRVHRASYANTWLLPVALLKRWAERWSRQPPKGDDLKIGAGKSLVGRTLRAVLASEARWVAGKRGLPFGLSLFALAEKPA